MSIIPSVPCPVCGVTTIDAAEDPFAVELERHGVHALAGDNANRDVVRKLAHPDVRPAPCADCRALIDDFDAAFAAHLLA